MSTDQDGLAELPILALHRVLSFLDQRSLGTASVTCKTLRDVCLEFCCRIKVPEDIPREILTSIDLSIFPKARKLCLIGDYENLEQADVELFMRTQPLPQHKELLIQEVRVSDYVSVATIQLLPTIWPWLQRVELLETRFNCPLQCTSPVALDGLLRALFDYQRKQLVHEAQMRELVRVHEDRTAGNVLVSKQVFEALSQLPDLEHLAVHNSHLHIHNLALAHLSSCTALRTLELTAPATWPRITVHGLRTLPHSLQLLQLRTHHPIKAWRGLAEACSHIPAVHLHVHCQAQLEQLPEGGLPLLPNLASLVVRSSVDDRDPLDEAQAAAEVVVLGSMLRCAPQLDVLELSNCCQPLLDLVVLLAQQVPKRQLRLSCHSNVDPLSLLASVPCAQLHLTLKGVTAEQLEQLTQHSITVQLVSLHLQRSHELDDHMLARAVAACPALRRLQLTTCRAVTTDLVPALAVLRRSVWLRVSSCRLVSARGWATAVAAARATPGAAVADVKYPSAEDLGMEVEFA